MTAPDNEKPIVYTEIIGGLAFKFTTYVRPDNDPDLDFLGTFANEPGEYRIVRAEGYLLGEWDQEARVVFVKEEDKAKYRNETPIDRKGDPDGYAWWEKWKDTHWNGRSDVGEWHDEEVGRCLVEAMGWRILATLDYSAHLSRHDYAYFDPPIENYMNKGDDENAKQEAYKYALRDWERMERYNDGHWHMVGVVTILTVDDMEFGKDSLWGVENDSDYWEDVMKEQRHSVLRDFVRGVEEAAAKMQRIALVLPAVQTRVAELDAEVVAQQEAARIAREGTQ